MSSATRSDSTPPSSSFRDPAGRLIPHDGRLLRAVFAAGIPNLQAFQASATVQRLSLAGRIVSSTVLEEAAGARLAAELTLPKFRRIVHGRQDLHRDLDASAFAASLRRRFEVVRSAQLPGSSRTMYLARRSA